MSDRRITVLRVENVKKLSALTIQPDGNVVVIGGANGSGKSSTLDSIWYALGGASTIPERPVREGHESAVVSLRIEGGEAPMVVTRKIKVDGSSTLEVVEERSGGGKAKLNSPQKVLDALVGRIAFDPLEFTRQKPAEQVETLRAIVGVDTTLVDQQIDDAVAERLENNKEVKRLTSVVESMPYYPDAPESAQGVAGVLEELHHAEEHNRRVESLRQDAVRASNAAAESSRAVQRAIAGVEEARDALRAAERREEEARAADDIAVKRENEAASKCEAAKEMDLSPIKEKIVNLDALNAQVRANREIVEQKRKLAEAKSLAEALQEKVDQLRSQRLQSMRDAKWPVDGLGFGTGGVTFRGLPFEQCSSAEKLRISVAIGASQKAPLNVMFVRDGSLLDRQSLADVEALAERYGAQVWIERVGDGDECSVVIEDGRVIDDRTVSGIAHKPA